MSEQKHTPEPWFLHGEDIIAEYLDGNIIARVFSGNYFCEINKQANARRIVECVNYCDGLPSGELQTGRAKTAIENMHAAMNENETLQARVKELEEYVSKLPADWQKDSGLETWFPLSNAELIAGKDRIKELEEQRDELLKYVDDLVYSAHTQLSYSERNNGRELITKIEAEKAG